MTYAIYYFSHLVTGDYVSPRVVLYTALESEKLECNAASWVPYWGDYFK